MRIIKYISILFGIILFLYAQDTPVNLESEAIDHSSIQLNWNVWDPADSYFDAIFYISNIEDNGNGTITVDFYLDNNEAGQTTFDDMGITVDCIKGRLLMFPPTWNYLHAGLKPVKKSKYIVGSYLHYL